MVPHVQQRLRNCQHKMKDRIDSTIRSPVYLEKDEKEICVYRSTRAHPDIVLSRARN